MTLQKQDKKTKIDISQLPDEFWDEVAGFFFYTQTNEKVQDDHGRYSKVSFRVHPTEYDMANIVTSSLPDKWFKNRATMDRAIYKVGRYIIMNLIKHKKLIPKQVQKSLKIYKACQFLETKAAFEQLKSKLFSQRMELMQNPNHDPEDLEENLRLSKEVVKLEKKMLNENLDDVDINFESIYEKE